jgi:predicted ester cyclase
MTTREDNIDLVRRFVRDCLNTGDVKKVREMVSEDFLRIDPVRKERGADDVERFLQERHQENANLEYSIHKIIADENYVAATLSAKAFHKPTAREIVGTGIVFIRIENGKIAEVESQWDRSKMPT